MNIIFYIYWGKYKYGFFFLEQNFLLKVLDHISKNPEMNLSKTINSPNFMHHFVYKCECTYVYYAKEEVMVFLVF